MSPTTPQTVTPATAQSAFWQGEFGDEYTHRNAIKASDREPFFKTIIDRAPDIETVLELGANKGHNLIALNNVKSSIQSAGLEINPTAVEQLQAIPSVTGIHGDILADEFALNDTYDLVMTCGVMIHLNPEKLTLVYNRMRKASNKYVLINEYFNPSPVQINYRGHDDRLFKRDFAGEFLDVADAAGDPFDVVDTGFLWRRNSPSWDDTTWFLFKRRG
jgi:pseudaminic acid biosynthesis-associated methylase